MMCVTDCGPDYWLDIGGKACLTDCADTSVTNGDPLLSETWHDVVTKQCIHKRNCMEGVSRFIRDPMLCSPDCGT